MHFISLSNINIQVLLPYNFQCLQENIKQNCSLSNISSCLKGNTVWHMLLSYVEVGIFTYKKALSKCIDIMIAFLVFRVLWTECAVSKIHSLKSYPPLCCCRSLIRKNTKYLSSILHVSFSLSLPLSLLSLLSTI